MSHKISTKAISYADDAVHEEEDQEDEEDDEYNDADADAEERQAAIEDEDDGTEKLGRKRRSSGRAPKSAPNKRKRMHLEAVDEAEIQALREDAVEQFGTDVLAEEADSKPGMTRGAERAVIDSIMASLHAEEERTLAALRCSLIGAPTLPAPALGAGLFTATLRHLNNAPRLHSPLAASFDAHDVLQSIGSGVSGTGATDGVDSFLGALARGVYGKGTGWHTSLGGLRATHAVPGALLHRLVSVPPLQIDGTGAGSGTMHVEHEAVVGSREGQKLGLTPAARERALAAASAALALAGGKKIAITSTVKFAGQSMQVTKMVTAGTEVAKAAVAEAAALDARRQVANAGAGDPATGRTLGLDALVSNLDKPEGINTLAKTNLDWEQYKAKAGLDEAFENRAQAGGYVEKQAFLGRVDARSEETAKAQRAEERRARDLAAPPH